MKRVLTYVIVFFYFAFFASALFISDPQWGYSLDLPEGFFIIEGNGNDRYQFKNKVAPIDFIVALYPANAQTSAKAAAQSVMTQLGAKGDIVQTNWRRNQCALAQYKMTVNGAEYGGWLAAVELKNAKGYGVFTAFAQEKDALQYENFIISCLDSIGIDQASWHETGPMTAFAFQNEGSINSQIVIDGKKITVPLDKVDAEANQFIVDREFGILTLYAKSDLWKEAWQRYYRLIYRDAYARLAPAAAAIQKSFGGVAATAASYDFANTLLHWTQGFGYARDFEGSDFTALPALLEGSGGDCDSRALLLAILLRHMEYDTVIFISPEYSHSVAGINVTGQGARLSVDGINYLVAETTAKVNLGLIAQEFADPAKWIEVSLYDINSL